MTNSIVDSDTSTKDIEEAKNIKDNALVNETKGWEDAQSLTVASDGKLPTKKRKRVSRACVYCQRSHMSCDEGRPCKRCLSRGIGELCRDGKCKRRGRKRKNDLLSESDSETEKDPPTPRKERRVEKTEVDSSERREAHEAVPSSPSDPSISTSQNTISTTTPVTSRSTSLPSESSTTNTISDTLSPSPGVPSNEVQIPNLWSESPPSPTSSSSSSPTATTSSSSASSTSTSSSTSSSPLETSLPSTFFSPSENQFIYYVAPCISTTPAVPLTPPTPTTTTAASSSSLSPLQSEAVTFTSRSVLSFPLTMHFPLPNYFLLCAPPQQLPSQFCLFDTRTVEGVSPSDVIPSEFEAFDSPPCLF